MVCMVRSNAFYAESCQKSMSQHVDSTSVVSLY
ncbi:hypothetical protein CKAH01_10572 [Colletotrichum kahawae]|uniref:Uncharacterized protein n=1 Tax=Colletotrichum kahawae TaxID=34407 RepID=A0AAE0CXA8_COLKA|nr:hypothetical protein CKAH01_10572 [Colletotrichum kahawae]